VEEQSRIIVLVISFDINYIILDVLFLWLSVRWDRMLCEELEFISTYYGILAFLIPVVILLILYIY